MTADYLLPATYYLLNIWLKKDDADNLIKMVTAKEMNLTKKWLKSSVLLV